MVSFCFPPPQRFFRRSVLFLIGCAIGAAIACILFITIDPRGKGGGGEDNDDGPILRTFLDSQSDAHTMVRRPVPRHSQSPSSHSSNLQGSTRSIASVGVGTPQDSHSQANGGLEGFRKYQSNVFQSIPGPCESVPVKQFGKDLCTSQPCMETGELIFQIYCENSVAKIELMIDELFIYVAKFDFHSSACELANSVNISVDPCDNFYEFACQGWLARNLRPNYSSKWSVFSRMEKMTSDIVIGMYVIRINVRTDVSVDK